MNRKIELEIYEECDNVTFYTFKYIDVAENEFDIFLNLFDNAEFKEDMDIVLGWLDKIGEKGAIDRFFRPERGNMKAVPLDVSKLRLYCFKISEGIVLLGNGGEKTTETYNEDPVLNSHAENILKIGRILTAQISNNTIQAHNNKLYSYN